MDAEGLIQFEISFCNFVCSESELINKVFPNLQLNFSNEEWLCERAIMAPRNEMVAKINKNIIHRLPGEVTIYSSTDSVMASYDITAYNVEFLNSLDLSELPSYKLELKVGVLSILMRNFIEPSLCNGQGLITAWRCWA